VNAGGFVDWGLAERVALALGGNAGEPGAFDQDAVDAACTEAVALVLDYSRLHPAGELPRPELIDRAEWTRLGLRTLRELSGQLERRVADDLSLPGPLGGVARSLAGAAAGAEAGIAVGYGARKVLGQYDVPLVPTERQPRLVFVGPNLAAAHLELGEDPGLFLRWIAIHESTHSIQFASVPWLRRHLAELLEQLIASASARLDLGSLGGMARRLVRTDPRAAVRTVLRGDLARLLARSPPGGDVRDRGPRRAPDGRRRRAARSRLRPPARSPRGSPGEPGRARRGDPADARAGAQAAPVQARQGLL
jgi:putative hydrolase